MVFPLVDRLTDHGEIPITRQQLDFEHSDSRNDLDPSLVYRLEPLSLLLRILVWDGADEVVAPAVLVDLGWVPLVALINLPDLSLTS